MNIFRDLNIAIWKKIVLKGTKINFSEKLFFVSIKFFVVIFDTLNMFGRELLPVLHSSEFPAECLSNFYTKGI